MFFSGCVVAFYLILDTLSYDQLIDAKLPGIFAGLRGSKEINSKWSKLIIIHFCDSPVYVSLLYIHCFSREK
jgi:hypothetical protein